MIIIDWYAEYLTINMNFWCYNTLIEEKRRGGQQDYTGKDIDVASSTLLSCHSPKRFENYEHPVWMTGASNEIWTKHHRHTSPEHYLQTILTSTGTQNG